MSVTRSEQMSITAVSPPSSGLRGVIARRPITAFLVLVLTLAYPLMALPILAFRGVIPGRGLLEILPIAPDEVAGLLLTLGALLPATVVVTWSADGTAGVRRLFRRLTRWRIGLGWWVAIATALPALTTALAVLAGDSLQPVDVVPFFGTQLGLLLVNLVLVNMWEELAWSGFLQTRRERRHNVFVAALITIVPFALVHEPLRLFAGDVTAVSVAVGVGLYIVLGLFFRPMLAVVLRGTRGQRPRRGRPAQHLQPHEQRQRHRGRTRRRRRPQAHDAGRRPRGDRRRERDLPAPSHPRLPCRAGRGPPDPHQRRTVIPVSTVENPIEVYGAVLGEKRHRSPRRRDSARIASAWSRSRWPWPHAAPTVRRLTRRCR